MGSSSAKIVVTSPQGADLRKIIDGPHPCVTIVTHEEAYALEVVDAALRDLDNTFESWIWSAVGGLQSRGMTKLPEDPRTEKLAVALYMLLKDKSPRAVVVMLDVLGLLDDERVLRLMRELIQRYLEFHGSLVLIDHREDIPTAIQTYATPFVLELPDEEEIRQTVIETLRNIHRQDPIEVDMRKHELRSIVKNLRGLSRRMIRGIIQSCVSENGRFESTDLNHVLAAKRRALHADGLLEYIETPADLSQVGGLNRLKAWLGQRRGINEERISKYGLTPPRGVLLLGVQGAGKSLCAKAIAAAWEPATAADGSQCALRPVHRRI